MALPPLIPMPFHFRIQSLKGVLIQAFSLLGLVGMESLGQSFSKPPVAHFLFLSTALSETVPSGCRSSFQPPLSHVQCQEKAGLSQNPHAWNLMMVHCLEQKKYTRDQKSELAEIIVPEGQPMERETKRTFW